MPRSFSNIKLFSSFVVNKLSVPTSRRGYAAAARAGASSNVRRGGAKSSVLSKKGGEASDNTKPWVPDPVTGYYRPESKADEIDAAELRQLLLKDKQ